MPMPAVFRVLQYSGFVCTELSSILLFILIITKSSSKIGSYKYLMATFTGFSMIYAIIEILTQPVMHIAGTGLIVYVDSFLRNEKVIGFHLTSLYCSSFGICVLLLSTHFCYRYLALCRPNLIRLLSGKRLIFIFFPAIFFGISWFVTVEICNSSDDFSMEFLRESLKKYYNEDSFSIGQLSSVYYYHDPSNQLVINWRPIIGVIILNLIITLSITSILIFAVKIYQSVNSQKSIGKMSKRTREMHQQLFYTSIFQSIIPFFTLFLPVGLFLTLPFLNVHLGHWANLPGAYISFYPAVDAGIAIFMIRDFRNAVFCKNRSRVVNIGATLDSIVTSEQYHQN